MNKVKLVILCLQVALFIARSWRRWVNEVPEAFKAMRNSLNVIMESLHGGLTPDEVEAMRRQMQIVVKESGDVLVLINELRDIIVRCSGEKTL